MNILSFSEEFSRLIIRYTKANSPNNAELRNVPLTRLEISNAVDTVLVAILGENKSNIDIPLLESPTTGIMIVTPTAPIVTKIEQKQDDADKRFRLFDSHPAGQDLISLDSPSQVDKRETNGCLQVLQDGKKFISRSSPAICITNIGRSDTFVCEGQEEATKSVNQYNLDEPYPNVEMEKGKILTLLNEVRQSALTIVKLLDNAKKMAFPSHIVQQSSNNLSGPNTSRTSCRTLVPPKIRRSSTALVGTPTSSKSLTTETEEDLADRRRSISGGAAVANSRKLCEFTRGRSVSSSNLSVLNTMSKPARNPRYAHVQSTIPKPIATKKKA